MPNRKAPATQAEIARYLKAMREAGFGAGRIEIEKPDGTKDLLSSPARLATPPTMRTISTL